MLTRAEVREVYLKWYIENVDDDISLKARQDRSAYKFLLTSFPLPDENWRGQRAFDCKELGWTNGELRSCLYYEHKIKESRKLGAKVIARFVLVVYNKAVFDSSGEEILDFVPIGYDWETEDKLYGE